MRLSFRSARQRRLRLVVALDECWAHRSVSAERDDGPQGRAASSGRTEVQGSLRLAGCPVSARRRPGRRARSPPARSTAVSAQSALLRGDALQLPRERRFKRRDGGVGSGRAR
jgi:hypothetical protein